MRASSLSTIAQLPCSETLPMNLARLAAEVDSFLEGECPDPFKPIWDCDAVVAFDQPGTRVLVGWSERPGHGLAGVLTVSVGPSLMLGRPVMRPDAEALCRKLVAHLQARIGTSEVIWHQIACHMSADWVDLLIDTLPDRSLAMAPLPGRSATPAQRPQPRPRPPADLPALQDAAQDRPARPEPISTPMRLTVHALNATLIAVWGPLGAAALAHGLVKGENLRTAAQLMVLSGLASAVMHSPKGQGLLALIPQL